MQAAKLQEQKFQCAVRDQIVSEQRTVISNLWNVLDNSGLTKEQIEAISRQNGVMMHGLRARGGAQPAPEAPHPQPEAPQPQPAASTGILTGMFRTLRQAGARANARFEFWRNRNRSRASHHSVRPKTERTGGISGAFRTLKSLWDNTAGRTATRKVAVAPKQPEPIHLPPSRFAPVDP